jgi:hypothetical protein
MAEALLKVECCQNLPPQVDHTSNVGGGQFDRSDRRAAQDFFDPEKIASVLSAAGSESQPLRFSG